MTGLLLAHGDAMRNPLLTASFMLFFISLSACDSVAVDEDTGCSRVEVTKTISLPVLPTDETSSSKARFSGLQCLDRAPDLDTSGRADCIVIAARRTTGTPACDPSDGLIPISVEHLGALNRLRAGSDAKTNGWNAFCELVQLDPGSVGGQACRNNEVDTVNDENGDPARGFCYLDAVASPPVGDPSLLANCPRNEKRAIRVTGSSAIDITTESKSLTVVCSNEVCPGP